MTSTIKGVVTVDVFDRSEKYMTKSGNYGVRMLYKQVDVCEWCVADCEGFDCDHLDWDRHVTKKDFVEDECPHCWDCEETPEESHCSDCRDSDVVGHNCDTCEDCFVPASCSCHEDDETGHWCYKANGYLCYKCRRCFECYKKCCNSLFFNDHYAAVYPITANPETGEYACALGHSLENAIYERSLAHRQMEEARVPRLI